MPDRDRKQQEPAVRVLPADRIDRVAGDSFEQEQETGRRWRIALGAAALALLAFLAATQPSLDPGVEATVPAGSSATTEQIDLTSPPSANWLINEWDEVLFERSGQINDIIHYRGSLVAIGHTEAGAMAWTTSTGERWRAVPGSMGSDNPQSSITSAAEWNGDLVAIGRVGDAVALWTSDSTAQWTYHGPQPQFASADIIGLAAGPELLAVGYVDGRLTGWKTRDGTSWSSLGPLQGAEQLRFALTVAGSPRGYLLGGEDDCGRIRCLPTILSSPDGIQWASADVEARNPQVARPGTVRDIVAATNNMIAVGTEGVFPDIEVAVWTSPRGAAWTRLAGDAAALQPVTTEIGLIAVSQSAANTALIDVGGTTHRVRLGSKLETDAGQVTVTDVMTDGIRLEHDGAGWLLRVGGVVELQRISYPVSVAARGTRVVIGGAEVGADIRRPVTWVSIDGGASWQRTTHPSATGLLSAVHPTSGNLVAAGIGADGMVRVWQSEFAKSRAADR